VRDAAGREQAPLHPEQVRVFLRATWERLLERRPIGDEEDFFLIGGDSLLAMRMLVEVESRLGRSLAPRDLLEARTIEALTEELCSEGYDGRPARRVRSFHPHGSRPPLFIAYPLGGHPLRYAALADALGEDYPVCVLESPWWDGRPSQVVTIEQLAAHHAGEITRISPGGPYLVGGFSGGGLVALEIARRLIADGREVRLVAAIDSYVGVPLSRMGDPRDRGAPQRLSAIGRAAADLRLWAATQIWRAGKVAKALLYRYLRVRWGIDHRRSGVVPERRRARYVRHQVRSAFGRYSPAPFYGPVTLFRCTADSWPAPDRGWGPIARAGLQIHDLAASHDEVLSRPYVDELAARLAETIDLAASRSTLPSRSP
jgi:thioesterase domain-containing protein/acyl carrier protein